MRIPLKMSKEPHISIRAAQLATRRSTARRVRIEAMFILRQKRRCRFARAHAAYGTRRTSNQTDTRGAT